MSNTYLWSISSLDCIPQVGDLTDYCVVSHWSCTGTDADGNTGRVYATVSFAVNEQKSNFIPFDQITEEDAIEWTKAALGDEQVAATYANIDSQIEAMKNPPIITPPLPWANPV